MFPNAELTCGKMLSNIANRGALYAMVIDAGHRERRSLNVYILYGIPAEHRNMPLDDALELIYRNFMQVRQGENGDIAGDTDESPYAAIPKASTRHPDTIQHLANLLSDNRCLTVLQYDCMLKYLQERREQQYKFEVGDSDVDMAATRDGGESNAAEQDQSSRVPDPEEVLQRRLLEILSKPTIPSINTDIPQIPEIPAKKSRLDVQEPAILNDPEVKNALDSLFDI